MNTSKLCTTFFVSIVFSTLLFRAQAQIPVMAVKGANCMPDEQYYLDRLNEPLFPPSETTVDIIDTDSIPCFPEQADLMVSDLYNPSSIPYFHPLTGVFLTTVETEPMNIEIFRTVSFTNGVTGFSTSINHSVIQWKYKPNSTDPLAQPYVYIEEGIIDYQEIFQAINDHPGFANDFTDFCGGNYNLGSYTVDTEPEIINVYPWGFGSRAVLYWRLSSDDHWYIQHVFINDSPYEFDCTINTDTLETNFCQLDQEAPQFLFAPGDIWLDCDAFLPPPSFPPAWDEISSEINYSISETIGGFFECDASYSVQRFYTATDVCGNSSTVIQSLFIFDETPPVFVDPPEDTSVPADAVMPNPSGTELADACSDVFLDVNFFTEGANIQVSLTGFDACGNAVGYVFEINALPPSIFPEDPGETLFTVNLGDETPQGPDLESLNTNNVYFYFTVEEDTIFTQFRGDQCVVYSILRDYKTFNLNNEEIEEFGFTVQIDVIDVTPPFIEAGGDTVVTDASAIPEPQFSATDDYGNPEIQILSDTIPGECELNFILERTYIAIDSCGNSNTDVQIIEVDADCGVTFLNPMDHTTEINVFPNPSNGVFFIQTGFDRFETVVFDLNGRKLAQQSHDRRNSIIDLSSLSVSGIFVLQISSGIRVERFMLSKLAQ